MTTNTTPAAQALRDAADALVARLGEPGGGWKTRNADIEFLRSRADELAEEQA